MLDDHANCLMNGALFEIRAGWKDIRAYTLMFGSGDSVGGNRCG